MVLSVASFDKKNNTNLVQDSLKLAEELIDKDIMKYAHADYDERKKIYKQITDLVNCTYYANNVKPYITFTNLMVDRKLANKINLMTADQRDYFRRVLTSDYEANGWSIWGYSTEKDGLYNINGSNTYYGDGFPSIVINPIESIKDIVPKLKQRKY